jgi:ferredoxin
MATVTLKALGRSWKTEAPIGSSILQAAHGSGAPEGSACGGVCACSTCHVYVERGAELLSAAKDEEGDVLDKAFDVRLQSRLGCQAKIVKDGDIVVEITRESLDAFYNEHPDQPDPRKAL